MSMDGRRQHPTRKTWYMVWMAIVVALTSCVDHRKPCADPPGAAEIQVNLDYQPLSDSLVHVTSIADLRQILNQHPLIRDYFLRRGDYPDDSVFLKKWYTLYSNKYIDSLLDEVHHVFGDERSLRESFVHAFRNIKSYYPDFVPPRVLTVITGMDTDLLVTDSTIVVGLDFYLGEDAKYRPPVFEYLMKQYTPDMIVPSCVMIYGIGNRFNRNDPSNQTVLADMVAYGKSFVFAKAMLPCTADSTLMWYSTIEMTSAREHEDLIWRTLISNEVIYSTNHLVKQRYLEPRPNTYEVSVKCPGRIGQWVGWQIMEAYRHRHPEADLQTLMVMMDPTNILKESHYKP